MVLLLWPAAPQAGIIRFCPFGLQVEYGSGFSEEEEASQAPPTAQLLGANLQLLERLQGLTHVTLQPASGSLGLDEAECSLTACFTSLESMQRLLCASPGMALAAGGGAAAAAVRPPTDTAGISSSDTGGGGGSSGDNGPEPCPGPKPRRAIMAGIKPAEGAGSSSSSGMCRAAASSSVPRQLASSHCVLSAQVSLCRLGGCGEGEPGPRSTVYAGYGAACQARWRHAALLTMYY